MRRNIAAIRVSRRGGGCIYIPAGPAVQAKAPAARMVDMPVMIAPAKSLRYDRTSTMGRPLRAANWDDEEAGKARLDGRLLARVAGGGGCICSVVSGRNAICRDGWAPAQRGWREPVAGSEGAHAGERCGDAGGVSPAWRYGRGGLRSALDA